METPCSKVQPNKMSCTRKATHFKQGDPENKYAMCSVCFALDKSPEGYTVRLGE